MVAAQTITTTVQNDLMLQGTKLLQNSKYLSKALKQAVHAVGHQAASCRNANT